MTTIEKEAAMYAAVDLGSNSFRLHIGKHDGEAIRVVKSMREPIRLGAGIDARGSLTEAAMQQALGDDAVAVRSQNYYLDITPPGQNKGTFVAAMAKRLDISLDAIATIGDMQNDLPMFKVSGLSVAMGNATDDVKAKATDVTTSNEEEGFAGAVELILRRNAGG